MLVTARDSVLARVDAIKTNQASLKREKEIEDYLISTGELTGVQLDEVFIYGSGTKKANNGFFLDATLKQNLDNYLVTAVDARWDGISIMSGMEGSGKSTFGGTICRYLDPTFPGEKIDSKSARRHVDRIVFTANQFSDAVAKSSRKQAILFDEAILALMSGDAGTNIQKMLLKEITLIRKKQLYIVLVIPSIFSLRMPIAVQRSRFLIHTYSPDGIKRGYFKFYNYPTKRQLYMKGKRDYNQDAVEQDFRGTFVDTETLFYDAKEYDAKKEAAIRELAESSGPKGKGPNLKEYKTEGQRNLLLAYLYSLLEGQPLGKEQLEYIVKLHNEYAIAVKPHDRLNPRKFKDFLDTTFGEHLDIGEGAIRHCLQAAADYASKPIRPLEDTEKHYNVAITPVRAMEDET